MAIEISNKNENQTKLEDDWVNIHVAVRNLEKQAALIEEIAVRMKANPEWNSYPTADQAGKINDLLAFSKTIKIDAYYKDKSKTAKDKPAGAGKP